MNKLALFAGVVLVALLGVLLYHQSQIVRYDAGNGTKSNFSPELGNNLDNSSSEGNNEICAVQQCHGPDFTCGNAPRNMACTLEYRMGDFCQQYFSCKVDASGCREVKAPEFDFCAKCAKECDFFSGGSSETCSPACTSFFTEKGLITPVGNSTN